VLTLPELTLAKFTLAELTLAFTVAAVAAHWWGPG
jgi:hypothetical protein